MSIKSKWDTIRVHRLNSDVTNHKKSLCLETFSELFHTLRLSEIICSLNAICYYTWNNVHFLHLTAKMGNVLRRIFYIVAAHKSLWTCFHLLDVRSPSFFVLRFFTNYLSCFASACFQCLLLALKIFFLLPFVALFTPCSMPIITVCTINLIRRALPSGTDLHIPCR